MRVLFNSWRDLAHPLAGGAEVVLDQLAQGLGERGHDVRVRCGGPIGERPYAIHAGGGDLTQYLLTPFHHRRLGRDVDVVVDVSNGMSFFTPLFERDLPTVSFVHHVHTPQWAMYFPAPVAAIGRRLETDAMPMAYRHCLTATVSPSSRQALIDIGVDADRIRVLPPAAALAPVSNVRSATPRFVALGRLTAHKRVDLLLDMWERVRPVTGGELVVIGDGPERPRLEARGAAGVRFVGAVDESVKAELLADAWALVHGASHEGWGLVITEAGLAGTPSIGFDVAGVRDAIDHDVSGMLARDADDFTSTWIRVGTDAALRERLATGARQRAGEARLERRIDAFEHILVEAVRLHDQRSRPVSLGRFDTANAGGMIRPPKGMVRPGRIVNSVVIPAYNEAERLPALLDALAHHVDLATTEVIVVDDGSADATTAVATDAMADFPAARVIRCDVNAGKGAALRRGVAAARGEFVVFMDADMATDLSCLQPLLSALAEGDVAIGSRAIVGAEISDASLHRTLMGGAFNAMVRRLTAVDVDDSQCGFKAFRGDVARLLFALSVEDGFALDVELLDLAHHLGLSIVEVPVTWRAVPGSKVRPVRDAVRMATALVRMNRRGPRRAVVPVLSVGTLDDVSLLCKEVRDLIRASDAVFVDDTEVSIVLPGLDAPSVDVVATRLGTELGIEPRRWSVEAADLVAQTR